ncbi:DNA polymerase delta small subunit [Dendrobium catenatum]|uniref:DNA polymerase delta small subunit n=1 Tax=Dendrobium catenatum TaxID=906689 RepID=A0A2I0V7E4_9ASPA|nr:DNA polymerase delta small subunit [Dendrobium catenatum]
MLHGSHLGTIGQEQKMTSQIVRVVIAGNSVIIPHSVLNGQALTPEDQRKLTEPIKEVDILLTQLAAAVPLDIMPGPTDPANSFLPQQFWRFSFMKMKKIRFLGTSGQNIDDLDKYSSAQTKLEFVERTLRWRHLAPTAPNTLGPEEQEVRLVCIPRFSESGVAVMVSFNTQSCNLHYFKC